MVNNQFFSSLPISAEDHNDGRILHIQIRGKTGMLLQFKTIITTQVSQAYQRLEIVQVNTGAGLSRLPWLKYYRLPQLFQRLFKLQENKNQKG